MGKPIIAIDIDDVLAAHAKSFVAYSNRMYGTSLTVDDYEEYWARMWQIDDEEAERRAVEYHESDDIGKYEHHSDALPVLKALSEYYSLVVVTSRRVVVTKITNEWVDKYFPQVFDAIYHAGIWDKGVNGVAAGATKMEICSRIGARYLIDDQLKHCLAVASEGIKAILFGDYPWNKMEHLPPLITRCRSWQEVLEYFNGQDR